MNCCFKIVFYALDGWICGADPCDVEPPFLHFDAHGLDCAPTMPQFYPAQADHKPSLPRKACKEKPAAERFSFFPRRKRLKPHGVPYHHL